MGLVTVYKPVADEPAEAPSALAPRGALDGARLVLIDNGKPNARELLELLAALLPVAGVEVVTKAAAGHPLEDEEAAAIAPRADVAITGLGDCGACSACSLRDAVAFERLGVPATVVITDAFVGHVARFADALGLPGYPALVVPHPVSSKDHDHLARLAEGLAGAAAAHLT
jgi:hypothetical protein